MNVLIALLISRKQQSPNTRYYAEMRQYLQILGINCVDLSYVLDADSVERAHLLPSFV